MVISQCFFCCVSFPIISASFGGGVEIDKRLLVLKVSQFYTFSSFFLFLLVDGNNRNGFLDRLHVVCFCLVAITQVEKHIEDGETLFRSDSLKSGGGLSDEPLIDTLVAYARQASSFVSFSFKPSALHSTVRLKRLVDVVSPIDSFGCVDDEFGIYVAAESCVWSKLKLRKHL